MASNLITLEGLRLLAPARPVTSGRPVTVRASLRPRTAAPIRATWDWEDGENDMDELPGGKLVYARHSHRYASPGVYRVLVRIDGAPALPTQGSVRFVTVRRTGQVGASGWVRDDDARVRVPFGFLITRGTTPEDHGLELRYLLGDTEVRSGQLGWLFADGPDALHFGGSASYGGGPPLHPFRVDVHAIPASRGRVGQQVAINLYAPDGVPGRDSPMHRISGAVRPGRVELRD